MTLKYEMIRDSGPSAKKGEIVYDFLGYDYNMASLDTQITGRKHKAMTLDADGGGTFFTVDEVDLMALPTATAIYDVDLKEALTEYRLEIKRANDQHDTNIGAAISILAGSKLAGIIGQHLQGEIDG